MTTTDGWTYKLHILIVRIIIRMVVKKTENMNAMVQNKKITTTTNYRPYQTASSSLHTTVVSINLLYFKKISEKLKHIR
jgi:hypothetical protein